MTLAGRGTTFVRTVAGPEDAPTVVLIHGLVASGGLNWFRAFEPLGEHFTVLAPDLRGHGRGIRSVRPFRLAACADDLAALIAQENVGPVIAVGYSMGGPIAELLWRRHPDLVAGLVLCATGADFGWDRRGMYAFSVMMTALAETTRAGQLLGHLPGVVARRIVGGDRPPQRPETFGRWARAEFRRHDPRALLEAAHACATFSARRWISEVDVPTAVVVTTGDTAVKPETQRHLVERIPGAVEYPISGGHDVCVRYRFGTVLTEACRDVSRRAFLAGV